MSRIGSLRNVENNQSEEVLQRTITNLVFDSQRNQYLNVTLNSFTNSINQQSSSIGNLASLETSNKNNLVSAINEVKQQANDIKTRWASVVGAPLTSSDTQAQLESKMQNIKSTFASNLTAKGQPSVGTEPLINMVNKIPNISTGPMEARGVATPSSSSVLFNLVTGGQFSFRSVTVSGLNFMPRVIKVRHVTSPNIVDFTEYEFGVYSNAFRLYTIGASGNTYAVNSQSSPAYINSTGFTLPIIGNGGTVEWYAST